MATTIYKNVDLNFEFSFLAITLTLIFYNIIPLIVLITYQLAMMVFWGRGLKKDSKITRQKMEIMLLLTGYETTSFLKG